MWSEKLHKVPPAQKCKLFLVTRYSSMLHHIYLTATRFQRVMSVSHSWPWLYTLNCYNKWTTNPKVGMPRNNTKQDTWQQSWTCPAEVRIACYFCKWHCKKHTPILNYKSAHLTSNKVPNMWKYVIGGCGSWPNDDAVFSVLDDDSGAAVCKLARAYPTIVAVLSCNLPFKYIHCSICFSA